MQQKNLKKKVVYFLFLLLFIFSFSGCQKNIEPITYRVTYNLMGGTYENQTENVVFEIERGTTTSEIIPTKNGYTYKGWTADLKETGKIYYSFNTPVTKNTVLYAIWEKNSSIFSLDLQANGGFFSSYNSLDDLIYDFFYDFSNFVRIDYDLPLDLFFEISYGRIAGNRGFFNSSVYKKKWMGLIQHLSHVVEEEYQPYYQKLYTDPSVRLTGLEEAVIRTELEAFLLKEQIVRTDWPAFTTRPYQDVFYTNGVWEYFKGPIPLEYSNATDYVLPIPHKINSYFMGWYDNPECSGEAITTIPQGNTDSKTYYAKWHDYALLEYHLETLTYNSKQELFTAFFSCYYDFIIEQGGNGSLNYNGIYSLNDFLNLASDFNAGRGQMRAIGDIAATWFLQKDIGGTIENQPTTKFIGYCYQNGLFKDFIPFLMDFFAWWRQDEGYTTPTNNGSDFFAESWAPLVDTAKFFYYNENTSYVKTERIKNCFLYIPSVISFSTPLPTYYTGQIAITLPTPTLAGYTFLGWYDNIEKTGTPITTLTSSFSGLVSLYAKWEKNETL